MPNKNESIKKFVIVTSIITLFIFIAMFIYMGFFIQANNRLDINPYNNLIFIKDDIRIKISNGEEKIVNLPKKFDDNHTYSYNFIPEKIDKTKKLFMFVTGSYHKFSLYHKDKLIYQMNNVDNSFIKNGGDYVRIIMIPDEYIGKDLTIRFTPISHSSYGIWIPNIVLGTHSELVLYSYIKDLDIILIALFLFIFGIESFIVETALIFYKKTNISSFLGSLYSTMLGIYIIIRTPAVYFLIPRGSITYVLDYLLFLVAPFTIALFMIKVARRKEGKKSIQKFIEIILTFFLIHAIIQIILNLFGIIEFIDTIKIAQISFIIIALMSTIIPFTIEEFEFKRILSISSAVLVITLIILMGVYIQTYRIRYMTILGLVGGVFILFQFLIIMKIYSNNYTISYKVLLNKNLAFTDNLTRILNRNAFEQDIKNIKVNGQKIMILIIDINNLKNINDTYGHNTGDYIIKKVADILYRIQNNFNKASSYRIGGDEFLVMAFDVDNNYAKKIESYINNKADEFKNHSYNIPFDFGMAYEIDTIDNNFNIDEFIKRVDMKMYEDKKLKKEG